MRVHDEGRCPRSSAEETMLSLFMSISGGVSWENVISPLKAMSALWVILYLFYISFTTFAVLPFLGT